MRHLFSLSALLLCTVALWAQEEKQNWLSLDAQLRSRGEYRNGALMPRDEGEQPAMFVNDRTRLTLQYDRSDDLTIRVSAQHTGVFGQDPQVDKQGRLAIGEAWAGMNFGKGFFGRLGRQPLVYDDERLLGRLDWNTAGRYHDAGLLGYRNGNHEVHVVGAFNQNDERVGGTYYAEGGQPYKSMQMLWYHYRFDLLPLEVSALAMNVGFERGNQETGWGDTGYLQTLGTHITSQPVDGVDVAASFYYQMGKRGTSTKAWMASGVFRYRIAPEWSITLGYDYLSGQDDDDRGPTNHAFNPLFGSHHMFYGSMDLFFTSPWGYMRRELLSQERRQYNPGLQDIHMGTICKAIPVRGLVVSADYHYFASTARLKKSVRGLGHEVDLQAQMPLLKDVTLQAGYSFMLGQNTMDIVKGGNHKSWQDWAWVQFNVNTRVFSKKL